MIIGTRNPLPLIVSRPLPAPSPARPEPTEGSDVQTEPETDPQPDQGQPSETDSGIIDVAVEPQVIEVVLSPAGEVATATPLEVASANQPANPFAYPARPGSDASNSRAVLWGIVASMSTLLVLGSLIFRRKDQE